MKAVAPVSASDGSPPKTDGWDKADSWRTADALERARVEARRTRAGGAFTPHYVGLALSGGGIRSATFSVGVLRSLSRFRLMNRIDYLSTVSGGGYAGAFYCSLFVPPPLRGQQPALTSPETPESAVAHLKLLGDDPLGSELGRDAIGQLRQGGNYLMPAGTTDTLFAAVIAARNWLAVFLVTGVALLACFLVVNLVRIAPIPVLRDAQAIMQFAAFGSPDWAMRPLGDPRSTAILDALPADRAVGYSYVWLLAGALIPLWLVPCAWAFWMTRGAPHVRGRKSLRDNWLPVIVALATAIAFAALLVIDAQLARSPFAFAAGGGTIVSALLGIGYHVAARTRVAGDDRRTASGVPCEDTDATLFAHENRIRAKLGRWLFRGVVTAAALAGLALVDDLGRLLYGLMFTGEGLGHTVAAPAIPTSLLAGVAAVRWLLTQGQASRLLDRPWVGPVLRRSGRLFAVLFALTVLLLLLSFWSAIAYEIVWHDRPVSTTAGFAQWGEIVGVPGWAPPLGIGLFTALVAIALGNVRSFLNQSSLAAFYAGRLRRAYLGATNAGRREDADRRADMHPDVEHAEDDIDLGAYYHPSVMAPLHIINVTVNETTAQSSSVIQRDRKGKSMTISPAGYATTRGSATDEVRAFPLDLPGAEQLPLSAWIGISGAAFSTGVGQNTSLGQSLLAAMVNMRLGYWWNAPTKPQMSRLRRFFADLVQTYLLREARASYEGTHTNRWYLSDGGHYENTGIYELVRRRVGFIIACDNGADPRYEFSDLVNLVRKLRIDFNVETEFLAEDELNTLFGDDTRLRGAFGRLEHLVPPGAGPTVQGQPAGPYAALARLKYPKDHSGGQPPPATLLLIKPRISGSELPDLLRYRAVNASFPQQPTADQFFDEAQWESYFRLGEQIADTIFERAPPTGKANPQRWWPSTLQRLPDVSAAAPVAAAGSPAPAASSPSWLARLRRWLFDATI